MAGVLDMFDPEVIKAMQGFGPSEADRQRALNMGLLSAGLGVLAGNRGYGRGQALSNAIGQGGLMGMGTYQQQLNDAERDQMRQLQTAQMAQGMVNQQRQAQRMAQFRESLPEDQRQAFDIAPQKVIENLPTFQKQQLVEMADPNDPLRTQKVWMRPGEVQGAVAGYGALPDILDPRVQEAKRSIAAAGRAQTNVNMPPMESEEQKAVGKDLAEQYSSIQKAGLSASGALNNLGRMKNLLSGIETGKLTPAMTEVSSTLESLGIKIDPRLPQKQAAAALSNELALRAKNQGGENLMPGAMSEADRRFLVQMAPSLANTPGGNQIILETLTRKAQRDQEVAKMARDYRKQNRTLDGFSEQLSAWSAQNPLFSDLQQSAPAQSPSSGFKIIGVR